MTANVEMILAPDGIEADVAAYDKTGKRIELPHKLVIAPFFFRKDAVANIAYLSVFAGKKEVSKSILQLPGTSGHLKSTRTGTAQDPKFVDKIAAQDATAKVAGDYEEEEYEEVEGEEYEEVEEEDDDDA